MFTKPYTIIYSLKDIVKGNSEFPEFFHLLRFANLIFQLFLPLSKNNIKQHDDKNNLAISYFPAFVFDDLEAV